MVLCVVYFGVSSELFSSSLCLDNVSLGLGSLLTTF